MRQPGELQNPSERPNRGAQLSWALTCLFLLALWVALCRHLAAHWRGNEQYSFGWIVPFLAAYLAYRRWTTRPSPGRALWPELRWRLISLAALLLPLSLVEQPNPEWRLVSWLAGAVVSALTIALIAAVSGRRWAWHFAFPAFFLLTAIPWPTEIEVPLIQSLMRGVASVTVELLNLLSVPARQQGNLIEIASGMLGVDEACSGVRSLQAALMASLFIGELFYVSIGRRLLLALVGVVAALAGNIVRSFFLAWIASARGIGTVDAWHDPAGFTILTGSLIVVWIVGLAISRSTDEPLPAQNVSPPQALPLRVSVTLALSLLIISGATELWYRSGPAPLPPQWHAKPPAGSAAIPIDARATSMLRYDRAAAASWREGPHTWFLYYFEWNPGASRTRLLAGMHRPEVCLPATGVQLTANRGVIPVEALDQTFRFESLSFLEDGRPLFVYFLSSPIRGRETRPFSDTARVASIQSVLWRERHVGKQVVELVLSGCHDAKEADEAFHRLLPRLLLRNTAPHAQPAGLEAKVSSVRHRGFSGGSRANPGRC